MMYLLYIGNYEPELIGLFTSKKRANKALRKLYKNNPDLMYVQSYIKPIAINKINENIYSLL